MDKLRDTLGNARIGKRAEQLCRDAGCLVRRPRDDGAAGR